MVLRITFRNIGLVLILMVALFADLAYGAGPPKASRLNDATPFTTSRLLASAHAAGIEGDTEYRDSLLDTGKQFKNQVAITTLAGVGFVTAWGVWKWDYFTRSPHAQPEGWFGYNTASGGADKLGHFYSSYAASHAFSWYYEYSGMPRQQAAFYGAFTSFIIMGYMEFGDSFSSYGFSYEDMIANTLGCISGYILYNHPEIAKRVDVRMEIGLHPESSDVITDYENTKFLLAWKLGGFKPLEDSFLKYFEIHTGYYTRGYENDEYDRDRNLFVGIGLNLTDMFRRQGYRRTATMLNYIQLPYTSVNYRHEVN